ncbi:MAG: LysR family transcriptional regulator [Anaerolineae bacterium]
MVGAATGNLDWNLVRTFVAVVDTGSLAAAARTLGLAHPTAARHVQQLETALGLSLFDRRPTGLVLNHNGDRLASVARSMLLSAQAFQEASLRVGGSSGAPVRITGSEFLADVFPGVLARLRETGGIQSSGPAPGFDLIIASQQLNLLQRDADIAVRHVRPQQQDLVCRRLDGLPFGLYASESYLAARGRPQLAELAHHWFIDGASEPRFARRAARLGYRIAREQFAFRSDSFISQLNAACAGWGIAGLPVHVAGAQPGLRRVLEDAGVSELEMWLVARADVRTTPYLKAAFDGLGDQLNAFVAQVVAEPRAARSG